MSNSFGRLFRITTFGESHGPGIGVVIDGCPSGLEISESDIQEQLDKRKPGQSKITSPRKESDQVRILSGWFEGKTTGTPLTLFIANEDARSQDYDHLKDTYRPSHADYTYDAKYGNRDYRGGGRSSARETAARVAAGAVALKILELKHIKIFSYVSRVGNVAIPAWEGTLEPKWIESNPVRCPEERAAKQMQEAIEMAKKEGDTLGGIIDTFVNGMPVGLGEPVYDKLSARLGYAMLGINAVKGFEIGSGFEGTKLKGSEHNDPFIQSEGKIRTRSNHSGGMQGGISNGNDLFFRTAFKPVATLFQDQESVDTKGNSVLLKGKGRHDPCVVPRAVPIVSAMTALVLVDFMMLAQSSGILSKA